MPDCQRLAENVAMVQALAELMDKEAATEAQQLYARGAAMASMFLNLLSYPDLKEYDLIEESGNVLAYLEEQGMADQMRRLLQLAVADERQDGVTLTTDGEDAADEGEE